MAVKWLREKCLFLPDYCPFGCCGVRRYASHFRAPGNIWVRVRVSFTTGAVRSAILATAGLLSVVVLLGFVMRGLVFSTKPIDWWEECVQYDLFCVEWDVKPYLSQSFNIF